MRRFSFGILIFVTALAPLHVAWLLMLVVMSSREVPATTSATPNPAAASSSSLGLVEAMVAIDPWFAGTIIFWLIPLLSAVTVFSVIAAALVCPSASRVRRWSTLLAMSVFLGMVLAAPWFFGLYRLLTGP